MLNTWCMNHLKLAAASLCFLLIISMISLKSTTTSNKMMNIIKECKHLIESGRIDRASGAVWVIQELASDNSTSAILTGDQVKCISELALLCKHTPRRNEPGLALSTSNKKTKKSKKCNKSNKRSQNNTTSDKRNIKKTQSPTRHLGDAFVSSETYQK